MRYATQALLAALAYSVQVLANANPFNVPNGGYNVTAGSSTTLAWTPTTSGTVSLILRSGASSNLATGTYIAQNISNSGSYTWNVASSIAEGSDYTVEIIDDSDTSQTDYTPHFTITSTVTVASSTSRVTSGASSSSTKSGAAATTSSGHSSSTMATSSASKTSSASGTSSTTSAAATQTKNAAAATFIPAAGVLGVIAMGAFAL
ncbi:hypothetical protein BT93_L0210 [Corymbia citriodora subsp. variegata]|uniref:Yeast cell wall synthesis Kre9/Knh1-like N-terminal domain-containing protein n=1 Tax=Corymbia citriodora subsp. variegata TaxID=360336 RepID=A0A8T0CID1_CORYI|nr:hypothetical protein BT93_L0210 [Corymbia citriodora subsp. variegata]